MPNPPLLPSDYYLMQVLVEAGVVIDEHDWRQFKAEVRRRAREAPQPAVVAGAETLAIISLVLTVVSVGLTIVASFFKPRPGRAAQLEGRAQDPESVSNIRRYAPRYGFDSLQEPATIGTTIPLVYTVRELFNGETVGGIRINMPLLWSQVQSQGGSQLLRAIFLLSEGPIGGVDTSNFAIGNNSISSYDLSNDAANRLGSRITVYFRGDGGRLTSSDRIAGRNAAGDAGNSEVAGGPDVFAIRHSSAWTTDFSSSSKPSTQTSFGIVALIGNNLGYRTNPTIRPFVNAQLKPEGDDGDARVVCPRDGAATVAREKYRAIFSTRSGIISGDVSTVGSTVTYVLDNSSDALTEFVYSTTEDGSNWTTRVAVTDNPFPLENGISDSTLVSLLTTTALVLDETNKKLNITVSFEAKTAALLFQYIDDGSYIIEYDIIFVETRNNEDDNQEISKKLKVGFYKETVYDFDFTPGTQPQLVNLGNGVYQLYPGTNSNINTNISYKLKFKVFEGDSPTSKTYNVSYRLKEPAVERCGDVASAVSSRQKAWDDAIVLGDLYKVGSALAICTERSPADSLFESEADFTPPSPGQGQAIQAQFTTVRPGTVQLTSLETLRQNGDVTEPRPVRATATNFPHIYKISLANITTSRPCRIVEIGIRSSMGARINGLCNFKDSFTYDEINEKACLSYKGDTLDKGEILRVDIFQSGVISTSEERYSFFRVSYREAGTNDAFTPINSCFGVRSITQQAAYNSLRFNMGTTKRWEFRFEPLSGWEIRSGAAPGGLELIDNKLKTDRFVSDSGVVIAFRGKLLNRSKDTFALNSVRRKDDEEIGIRFTDEDSYLDAWGRLAEDFVYEEASTTVSGSPEHEIVYVNEIVENETKPEYDNLAIVGLNIRSSIEFQQFSQFSAYVTQGIECRLLQLNLSVGPTHLFPNILLDLLTNPRYGRGDLIPDELIDFDSFTEAANWCRTRGYFFDGAITNRQNLRQWAADTAATHLLSFGEADGKFFLRPAFPTGTVPIKGLFTAGNIREGSFKFQYLDAEDRRPIQVSIRWREERASTDPTNPGLFPVEREMLVREYGTPDTAPIESVDMSDYCTTRQHALDAAKYIIRARRLSTSAIRFETTYEGVLAALAPSDFIKVAMDTTVYDEYSNGVITPTGTLVSTKPLTDGTYSAIIWNGDNNNTPQNSSIQVSNEGTTASPTGIIFTLRTIGSEVKTYQVESIEATEEGYLAIEAVHTPTTATGVLTLADGFDNNGNWTIQE